MKKSIIFIMTAVIFLCGQIVYGGQAEIRYSAKTGDSGFDDFLSNVNVRARTDMDGFATKLSTSYGVSKVVINELVAKYEMPPADVYMTVKTAKVADKPVSVVADAYKAHKGKGWGFIAKKLGIKPGSKEFHALKKDEAGLGEGKGKAHKKEKKGKGKGKGKYKDDD